MKIKVILNELQDSFGWRFKKKMRFQLTRKKNRNKKRNKNKKNWSYKNRNIQKI